MSANSTASTSLASLGPSFRYTTETHHGSPVVIDSQRQLLADLRSGALDKVPDALLVQAAITTAVANGFTELMIRTNTAVGVLQIGGPGGPNTKDCDDAALARLKETTLALGGVVQEIPAAESRPRRFPSGIPGHIGQTTQRTAIEQLLCCIGGARRRAADSKLTLALVLRVTDANAKTAVLTLEAAKDRRIWDKAWAKAFSLSNEYMDWLKAQGHLETAGERLAAEMAVAEATCVELRSRLGALSVGTWGGPGVALEALTGSRVSSERTPQRARTLLRALATVKFAVNLALCGSLDVYKGGGQGFAPSPAEKLGVGIYGNRFIDEKAAKSITAYFKETSHSLPLTSAYDPYFDRRYEDAVAGRGRDTGEGGGARYDKRIANTLVAAEPTPVDLSLPDGTPRRIIKISDPGEECDDGAAAQGVINTWAGCTVRFCLTDGEFNAHERLRHLLRVLHRGD